jgi:hypothetical protein
MCPRPYECQMLYYLRTTGRQSSFAIELCHLTLWELLSYSRNLRCPRYLKYTKISGETAQKLSLYAMVLFPPDLRGRLPDSSLYMQSNIGSRICKASSASVRASTPHVELNQRASDWTPPIWISTARESAHGWDRLQAPPLHHAWRLLSPPGTHKTLLEGGAGLRPPGNESRS